jgi:hypothetical protein
MFTKTEVVILMELAGLKSGTRRTRKSHVVVNSEFKMMLTQSHGNPYGELPQWDRDCVMQSGIGTDSDGTAFGS